MERIESILDLSKDVTSMSFKLNICPSTDEDVSCLIGYINSVSDGQRFISIGQHDVGQSEIPHIFYFF